MIRFGLAGGIVLACGLLMATASGGSAAAPVRTSWAGAAKVSRSRMLNSGAVDSISCAAAGDCVAGGSYSQSGRNEAFVVNETNGSWGKPIAVSGGTRHSPFDDAYVNSVSCPAVGDCAAGGFAWDGTEDHPFVVNETNGVWGKAIEVRGTATRYDGAAVTSISCAAVGDCAAGGYDGYDQAFVVSETNGRLGKAIEVPGILTLDNGSSAEVNSISCAAPGDCAAGGDYADGYFRAFVVSETNGSWGDAIEVPGTATLNPDGDATVNSISCAAAGECAASVFYSDSDGGNGRAFVVDESNGSWGAAIEVPGTLNAGGNAFANWISCPATGGCVTVGGYTDGNRHAQIFAASESNGAWGTAIEVPGTTTLPNRHGPVFVESLSCSAADECAAGGQYSSGGGRWQAFVVSETNGSWGTAIAVPGTATLNNHFTAGVESISCAAAGECAGGGHYNGQGGDFDWTNPRAFVVSETNDSWGTATQVRDFPASCYVPDVVGTPLRVAKRKLTASYCGPGKIAKVYSAAETGHVVAQRPKPGNLLKAGGKVALTVSKGKKT